VDLTPTNSDGDDIGMMFRYQDPQNYYRLSFNSRFGFTRLEKKVGGVFSALATNARGYSAANQTFNMTVEVRGGLILVYGGSPAVPLMAVNDSSLSQGSIALFTQDTAKFDNVTITPPDTTPSIVIGTPLARTVVTGNQLTVTAYAVNVPAGGYVQFSLDGSSLRTDTSAPFSATYTSVSQGDHTVTASLYNNAGGLLASDDNGFVGSSATYYVTVGDSITNGEYDKFMGDNSSLDGRIRSLQGYQVVLSDLLLMSQPNVPTIVYNEAIPADTSADLSNSRINSIRARHVNNSTYLLMIGTNDSSSTLNRPSGLGCTTGCGGTFKQLLQGVVDKLIWSDYPANTIASGRKVHIAKVPPAFGAGSSGSDPAYTGDPLPQPRNQAIIEYNAVITSEITGALPGPDFFNFFLEDTTGDNISDINLFSLFEDILHPNGLGYRVMGQLWHNSLTGGTQEPFYLQSFSAPSIYYKQNLRQVGREYYIDQLDILQNIPPQLQDSIFVMTANADKANSSANYLSFFVDRPSTVYIGYDSRASARPDWIASTFTSSGLTIGVSDPAYNLKLYSRSYGANSTVTLGGNMAAGAAGALTNYIVIVREN